MDASSYLVVNILGLIDGLLALSQWLLIVLAVMSWLIAFGVVNRYNRAVFVVYDTLNRVVEPVLRPIRRVLPNLGGVDVSFIILWLLIQLGRILIHTLQIATASGSL
jgi:YggT family protein